MRNKKLKNGHINIKGGFSIGEVILSVFILGVAMVTILAIYANGINHFQDERDAVIASMLAQEGVELARNIRDNNWADRESATDASPDTFDNFNSNDNNNCRLDMNDNAVTCAAGSLDKALYLDASNFYVHDGCCGNSTKFRRRITLDFDDANAASSEEVIVTSFVSWDGSDPVADTSSCVTINSCVFSRSTLTDWGTGL